jgi:RND family efflux transporter MFP subunit
MNRTKVVGMGERAHGLAFMLTVALVASSACGGERRDDGSGTAPASDTPHDMAMDASIQITPDVVQTFGITFGTADVRALVRTVRAVGAVEFDETRMVYVAPKFGGWAERLHVDFRGRSVRAGEPLLDVYAPDLVTAQEELLLAARMAEDVSASRVTAVTAGANDLLASARRRLEYWDISGEQIDRLLETGEVRRTLTLHAPTSGVVMEKNVVEGQAFQAGTNLYMIAGLSEVWVNAEIFESDVALVRAGMTADVTVDAVPGRTFAGRIDYVYPTLEERTRSMRARVVLANPGGVLKPGMYATVRMRAELDQTLTLPASAVLYTGERAVTFVDMGGGNLMPHEIEVGVRGGDFVQVLSGVQPGARVVTSAQFLLDSESNLAEVMRAAMAQMGSSGTEMDGMDMNGPMPGMEPPPDSIGGH